MEFDFEAVKALLEMFGGEETTVSVVEENGELRAYYTEYPEEGSVILSCGDDSIEAAGLARRAKQRKALEHALSRDAKYAK